MADANHTNVTATFACSLVNHTTTACPQQWHCRSLVNHTGTNVTVAHLLTTTMSLPLLHAHLFTTPISLPLLHAHLFTTPVSLPLLHAHLFTTPMSLPLLHAHDHLIKINGKWACKSGQWHWCGCIDHISLFISSGNCYILASMIAKMNVGCLTALTPIIIHN